MLPTLSLQTPAIRRALVAFMAFAMAVTTSVAPVAPVATPATAAGFGDLACTTLTALPVSANTGEKPQSKVWKHDGAWWAVLPTTAATPGSGTWLWKLVGDTWTSVIKLSNNTDTHADALKVGAVTHILLYRGTSSELVSVEYGAGTYAPWSLRPAAQAITLDSGVETATIAVDSTGRMWLASAGTTSVYVRSSVSPYTTWNAPITLGTGVAEDDIAVVTAFDDDKVGVLWSNQNTERFGFKVHADGDAEGTWSADEVPADGSAQNIGLGMADDHMNLAVAADGTIYAAVKTSYDTGGSPKLALLVRRPSGTWDPLYGVSESGTRGIVLLNTSADELLYLATSTEGAGNILARTSPTAAISFGAPTTLMSGSFNEVTSTKQNYTDDLVVLASSGSTSAVGRHCTSGAPPANTAPVAQAGALSTPINTAGNGTLVATDADSDPLTYSIVTNGTKGTAVVTNAATGAYTYTPSAGQTGADSFTFKANDTHVDSNTATVSVTITSGAVDPSLVGWWTMDETGGTTAADSGAAPLNTATTSGNPTFVPGKTGNAIRLNGTSQYASAPDEASLDIANAITMAAWVKPGQYDTQDIIAKDINGSVNGYQLSLATTKSGDDSQRAFVRFNQQTSGDTYRVNAVTMYPIDGSWQHVAATYDGATIKLYIDGTLEGSMPWTGTIATNSTALGIGAQSDNTRWLDGDLDDVRLYNRALSAVEILALAAPGNSAPVAQAGALSTPINTVGNGTLVATDADSDPLTYSTVTTGTKGTAVVTNASTGAYTYTPMAGQTGADSFTFRAYDGTAYSNTATVSVTITDPSADVVMVGAGDISDSGTGDTQTAALINALPSATVFTLGDNAYPDGSASNFSTYYEPTWGAFKARTYPSVGNHDWTNSATGYFPEFASTLAGVSPAGSPNGYYSYDQGTYWHVIVLNTEIDYSAGSAQEIWLRADLAANASKNVLAYWHRPMFSSGNVHGTEVLDRVIWDDLYEFGADLVLNGHEHWYERFAPQTPDGVADAAYGIRQITCGTGGGPRYSLGTLDANSEVHDGSTWGVCKLTLREFGYDYEFIPVAGGIFTDSGSGAVHNAPPPITNFGLQFDGTNDYVTFGAAPGLNAANFTVETWFKWTGGGATTTTGSGGIPDAIPLVAKGAQQAEGSNVDMNYFLGIKAGTGTLVADFEEGVGGSGPLGQNHPIVSTAPITTNVWHHAAATYDGTTWNLYLDGVNVGTATIGEPVRSDSIQHASLGSSLNTTGGTNGFFEGTLDEARIWNVARSQVQIQGTMNSEITSGTGLLARWGLDEGTGTSVASSVGTFPGTLTNGPTWVPGFVPTGPVAPVCSAVAMTTPLNTAADAAPACSDANSDPLTYTIVGAASHGTATVASGQLHYVPTTGYSGPDSFTYRAYDGSAYSNTATVTVTVTAPVTNYGLQFDGSNDYVTFGQATSTLGASTFTLEAWVNRGAGGDLMGTGTGGLGSGTIPQAYPVLTKGCGEGDGSNVDMNYWLGVTSTGVIAADFEADPGGQNYPVIGTNSFPTGEWHHIAATYDGQVWRLYLDGALDTELDLGTARAPRDDSIQNAAIGTSLLSTGIPGTGSSSCQGYFSGAIDEARVWNVVRTGGEIDASWDTEITGPTTGLLGRWGMNEGSGTTIASSVATIPGTLTNGPTWVPGFVPTGGNLPPSAPTNPAPANGATGVAASPTLTVDVAPDPDGDPQTVTFFGRPKPTAGEDFTLVVLPDTQHYTDVDEARANVYRAQTQWIVDKESDLNIAFVSHLGDITEHFDSVEVEWQRADSAMDTLDNNGVPNAVSPGNHDLSSLAATSVYYDQYFPPSRYDLPANPWYGGWLGEEAGQTQRLNKDNYELFTAGGIDFLIIHLEVDMPTYAVAWANDIISRYPDRQVILSTHAFVDTSGNRPNSLITGRSDGMTASAVWTQLIYPNCNVVMVVNGHYPGEGRTTTNNSCGQPVHQVLTDYQSRTNGGDGWLRYYVFKPAAATIEAYTYKVPQGATLGSFEVDSSSQFTLAWPAAGTASAPFTEIGDAPVSGGTASISWPGLDADTEYEWYAVANDGTATTPSATWSFTTGTAAPGTFTLSGAVTAGGSPLPGATVHVILDDGTYIGNTASVAGGAYSITLAPGTYKLWIQPNEPGYGDQYFGGADLGTATPIGVSANTVADVPLVGGPSTFTLSGAVTAGGSPLPGATVHVILDDGTYIGNTASVAGGAYSITLAPGTYKLWIQPNEPGYGDQYFGGADLGTATPIGVSANTVADVPLVGGPSTFTLSGAVTAGGSPLPGATVHVILDDGTYIGNTASVAGGAYSITLAPGTYKLWIQPNEPGYGDQYFGGADLGTATPIPFAGDTMQNIALVVTLSGAVTAGGSPLPGATVHVILDDGTYIGNTASVAGGAYSITLAPGTYKLWIQPNEPGYGDQYFGGADLGTATPIGVSANTVADVPLVGGPSTFTLSGAVTAGGSPLPGATVHVILDDGTYIGNTASVAGGAYSITLAPGTYKLWIQPNEPGYGDQYFGGADLGTATPIGVSANTVADVPLVGGPSTFTLSGAVTAGGSPLPGATVHVILDDGTYIGNTASVAGGAYSITLAPGTYKLWIQPNEPGYGDQYFGGADLGTATPIGVSANTVADVPLVGS